MENNLTIHLTKSEALSIFCFSEINPVCVLKDKFNQINNNNHEYLYKDIRRMNLVCNLYLSYKSDESRYVIQGLCKRFIENIYKNDESNLSFEKLCFLIHLIAHFRNVKDYKTINKLSLGKTFLETTRQNLLKINAIPVYQKQLF